MNEYDAPLSLICAENSAYGKLETMQHIDVNRKVIETAGPAINDDCTMAVYIPDPSIPPTLIKNCLYVY